MMWPNTHVRQLRLSIVMGWREARAKRERSREKRWRMYNESAKRKLSKEAVELPLK